MGTPTLEEMYEYRRKHAEETKAEKEEAERKIQEAHARDLERAGLIEIDEGKVPKKYCDHPNTMENSTATFFWIVAMVVGTIFKDNWIIWIVATFIWLRFIMRHSR